MAILYFTKRLMMQLSDFLDFNFFLKTFKYIMLNINPIQFLLKKQ